MCIRDRVKTDSAEFSLEGCLFDGKLIKLTKIMDYQVDVSPNGAMLLVHNKDIPGVVGKVGTVLGSFEINIAEFILSRNDSGEIACSIIKIDDPISNDIVSKIAELEEIINIKQIIINE